MSRKQCKLFKLATLPERRILIPKGNALGLVNGNAIRLSAGEWQQVALVQLDKKEGIRAEDKDNIQSSKWDGTEGTAAEYEKLSKWSYQLDVLIRSKRAWVGFLLMLLGLLSTYGNAALQKDGTVEWHLGAWKWLIFAVSAATALAIWLRDTWL